MQDAWGSSFDSPGSLAKKHKVLCALDSAGVAGIHLLAGLGYSQAVASLLRAGANPSIKVADP